MDAGTLRALSKHNKQVGLQKLRFYCQLCQKQCRDENAFKCHIASEGHLRQMRVFSQNSSSIIDKFSKEFRDGYLRILSQRHGRVKIDANKVYQEYIADKHHIHMNSTIWTTLSEFVRMLGRESYCKVEESAFGWDIQYIDRDPKTLARAEEDKKRKRIEIDEEERRSRQISVQIASAASLVSSAEGPTLPNSNDTADRANTRTGDGDGDDNEGIIFTSAIAPLAIKTKRKRHSLSIAGQFIGDDDASNDSGAHKKPSGTEHMSALVQEGRRKEAQPGAEDKDTSMRTDHWLHVGIQVKIMNKVLGSGKFYKRKGDVVAVVDRFAADVIVEKARLRLDQRDLETVIPKIGGRVLILNGICRGCHAILTQINVESYTCSVKVLEGPREGSDLCGVEFEDVSKVSK